MRFGIIDVIKVVFALIIVEFHLNSGVFPGGRLAVEGFFLISGFLMMYSINYSKEEEDLGLSTVRFLIRKWKALIPLLVPSIMFGHIIYSIKEGRTFRLFLERIPLLIFDVIPLREAGFKGSYVVGISWYLSAMFISLAILYPLCKKYKQNFTLVWCPLLCFLLYGYLSHSYGHLAVASMYIEGVPISGGLLRGLAGSSAGVVLFECWQMISKREVTRMGCMCFTLVEWLCFAFFIYSIHYQPKSPYDYVTVFAIWFMLLIGVSNFSLTSKLCNVIDTKPLRTMSTLIVLNHCCWRDF